MTMTEQTAERGDVTQETGHDSTPAAKLSPAQCATLAAILELHPEARIWGRATTGPGGSPIRGASNLSAWGLAGVHVGGRRPNPRTLQGLFAAGALVVDKLTHLHVRWRDSETWDAHFKLHPEAATIFADQLAAHRTAATADPLVGRTFWAIDEAYGGLYSAAVPVRVLSLDGSTRFAVVRGGVRGVMTREAIEGLYTMEVEAWRALRNLAEARAGDLQTRLASIRAGIARAADRIKALEATQPNGGPYATE